jgi:rRNA-processing protein FCF1
MFIIDANVLISLCHSGIADEFLSLPDEIYITDTVLFEVWEQFNSSLLAIHWLSNVEFDDVKEIKRNVSPKLSNQDCSVLWLAERLRSDDLVVLTDDLQLTREAINRGFQVQGFAWCKEYLNKYHQK